VARWTVSWLLLIATATAGVYWGTNAVFGVSARADETYAMQSVGELGSPTCTLAVRALVDAGEGSAPEATPEQRAAWDRAARDVRRACGTA
jgi:hypothetical protein